MSHEAHRCSLFTVAPGWLVFLDGRPVAAAMNPVTAQRIGELLDRHGLVDVPDTAAALGAT